MNRKEYYQYIYKKTANKWKQKAKENAQYGDYIIIEYLGKTISPNQLYKVPLHRVKLKCKCGYEKIVACHTLYVKSIMNSKCKDSRHGNYPTFEILFNSWYSMNRACSPFLSTNKDSTCVKKGINVYEPWKLKEKKMKTVEARTLYKRYENFILDLLKFSHWSINDLKNKRIRVKRININKDFEPYNLKLYNLKLKKFFIPLKSQIDSLINEQK